MPELWSEPEKDNGFDLFDTLETCCFSSCFGWLFALFIIFYPIIAIIFLVCRSK